MAKMFVTEKEKLKEGVLVNLRSVTQSAKGGVLLSRLQEDYRKLIGTVIPLQSLSYSTLEEFLNDIPNVVQIRRKPDGQLYVEAVIDAATAHLASLISKQKGATAKSAPVFKKRVRAQAFTAGNNKAGSSSDEKDKIIQDLRNALEREKNIVKDFSSQVIRLNSIIAVGQGTLASEQEKVRKLEIQLQASKKKEERIENSNEETEVYIRAINNLKSKLLEQEDINKRLTKVKSLNSVNLTWLKEEESALLLLKNEIDDVIKKQCSGMNLYYSLNCINSTIYDRIKRINELEDSLELGSGQEEKTLSNSTTDDNNNYSNILNLYSEQCKKIQNLETRLEEQNSLMKSFAEKYEKQFKNIEVKNNKQWDKRFQKMDAKINNECIKSNEMKNTIEQLTGYFKSLVLSQTETTFQDNNCQPAETENNENNIQEESSEVSSVSFDYTAKKKKKRKKPKEEAQSKTVYVPPHRRTSELENKKKTKKKKKKI